MMAQYRRAKAEIAPDTILFFRLGDFYEMFFEDAVVAADILGIALTKRQSIPMCGVPYHAADAYLAKLIRAGKKVALCDQMEDPAQAKGIVKREVTGIMTPGTVLTDSMLDAARPNYLAGLHRQDKYYGLAMLDLSTGEFWMEEATAPAALLDDLARYAPPEVILSERLHEDAAFLDALRATGSFALTVRDDWIFDPATADDGLCRHLGVQSLAGFGGEGHPAATAAAGALLYYVTRDLRRNAAHVRRIRFRTATDAMMLDESTLANLDLLVARGTPRADAPTTLLKALDTARTAMGSRLLRDWLVRPLQRLPAIVARHDAVAALLQTRHALDALRQTLGAIKDLERLLARLSAGTGNGRDVRALAASLHQLPALHKALAAHPGGRLAELRDQIVPQDDLVALVARALVDEPPMSIKEGGVIRKGYHAELDELRAAAHDGKQWIAELQAREAAARQAQEAYEADAARAAGKIRDMEAELAQREEAARLAREEAAARAAEEAAQRARVEAELQAQGEAERQARETAELKVRISEERLAELEQELTRRAEEVRQALADAEQQAREEADRRAQMEQEHKQRAAAEQAARAAAEKEVEKTEERRRKLEEQLRAKEREVVAAREAAETRATEEAAFRAQQEAEQAARAAAEQEARDAAQQKIAEAEQRIAQLAAELQTRDAEVLRAREEVVLRVNAEAEARAQEEAERQSRAQAE